VVTVYWVSSLLSFLQLIINKDNMQRKIVRVFSEVFIVTD
jgi:hypothetical protein